MDKSANYTGISRSEYQQILIKIEELEKELQVQQVKINLLREEQKKLLEVLKNIGLDEFDSADK
jgi:hypothetical protein